jgi:hypothetical protein
MRTRSKGILTTGIRWLASSEKILRPRADALSCAPSEGFPVAVRLRTHILRCDVEAMDDRRIHKR